jgi:anaerobic nitric oxide reductase flavorubredoxin
MGLATVGPGIQALYKPSVEDEKQCYEFGKQFAVRMKEYDAQF